MQSNHGKIPPCQYFFCTTCNKIVPRFIFYKKKNVKKHNCEKSCYHYRNYKKKSHYCVVQNVCNKIEKIAFKKNKKD